MLLVESLVHIVIVLFGHLFILLLISVFIVSITIFVSLGVSLDVTNDIDVGGVDVPKGSHVCIHTHPMCSVNTHYLNSVSRLDMVYEVFVSTHLHRLRSLSFRHSLWSFLHLDILLVREHALVMNLLECEPALALLADLWLSNSSSFNVLVLFLVALATSETGFFHLGNGVGGPDDNSLECYQLINVLGVELSDLVRLHHAKGTHLNYLLVLLHFLQVASLHASVHHVLAEALLLVNSECYKIKNGDDICGVVFKLFVQRFAELEQMAAIHLEYKFLRLGHVLELLDIHGLNVEVVVIDLSIRTWLGHNCESHQELFQLALKRVRVDVSSPKHLSVGGHLGVGSHVVCQVRV